MEKDKKHSFLYQNPLILDGTLILVKHLNAHKIGLVWLMSAWHTVTNFKGALEYNIFELQ